MAGGTIARTAHFALHRLPFDSSSAVAAETSAAQPSPIDLFAIPDVWMGALVPKRWAKHAVTRNAIKRQIYTVSDEIEARLPQAAHVVRLRSGFDRKTFTSATSVNLKEAVRSELNLLFERSFDRQLQRSGPVKS